MIRVLVADDQGLVRAGIVATVDAQEGMTVVGEAADGGTELGRGDDPEEPPERG